MLMYYLEQIIPLMVLVLSTRRWLHHTHHKGVSSFHCLCDTDGGEVAGERSPLTQIDCHKPIRPDSLPPPS